MGQTFNIWAINFHCNIPDAVNRVYGVYPLLITPNVSLFHFQRMCFWWVLKTQRIQWSMLCLLHPGNIQVYLKYIQLSILNMLKEVAENFPFPYSFCPSFSAFFLPSLLNFYILFFTFPLFITSFFFSFSFFFLSLLLSLLFYEMAVILWRVICLAL